jgi:predicted DNA binding CopG/RHH family protein
MAEPKDPPIPLRIPPELLQQIESVAALTGLSKQDVMRLCMRIGLVDLKAAEHDLPGIVKRIADDKGVSFQAFADAKQAKHEKPLSRQDVSYIAPRPSLKPPKRHDLNERA